MKTNSRSNNLKVLWQEFQQSEKKERDLSELEKPRNELIVFLRSHDSLHNENIQRFKDILRELFSVANNIDWGIDIINLGLNFNEDHEVFTLEIWNNLHALLKKFMESEYILEKDNAINEYARKNTLFVYSLTETLTPIFHIIDPRYPILNSPVRAFYRGEFRPDDHLRFYVENKEVVEETVKELQRLIGEAIDFQLFYRFACWIDQLVISAEALDAFIEACSTIRNVSACDDLNEAAMFIKRNYEKVCRE